MLLVIEAGVCFFLPVKMGVQFTNISSLLPNALRAVQVFETFIGFLDFYSETINLTDKSLEREGSNV
jgi:hypothetical protein